MIPVLKFSAYLAVVVIGACLLAPVLYWTGESMVEHIPLLKGVPFARYFNRAVLIMALGLLWPALKWMGIRSWTDLGLRENPRFWAELRFGVLISVVGIGLMATAVLILDGTTLRSPFPWHFVLLSLGTGIAVGLLEEVFFRGALFGVFRQHLSDHKSLMVLSTFFALLHFLKPHKAARKLIPSGWLSGFELLPYAVHQFKTPMLLLTGLLTLFIFGWILGYMVLRTRSLALSIGLHTGWVFALRTFLQTTKGNRVGLPWLGQGYTTGFVPLALLLVSLLLLHFWLNHRDVAVSGEAAEET